MNGHETWLVKSSRLFVEPSIQSVQKRRAAAKAVAAAVKRALAPDSVISISSPDSASSPVDFQPVSPRIGPLEFGQVNERCLHCLSW